MTSYQAHLQRPPEQCADTHQIVLLRPGSRCNVAQKTMCSTAFCSSVVLLRLLTGKHSVVSLLSDIYCRRPAFSRRVQGDSP